MKTLIILISSMFLICCSNSNLGTSQIKDDFQIDSIDHTHTYCDVDTVPPESTFDGILGLYWGMRLEDAISKLTQIGIRNYRQIDNESILYEQKVEWGNVCFDVVGLYFTSYNQNKYLSEIEFMKWCDSRVASQKIDQLITYFKGKKDVAKIASNNKYRFRDYLIWPKEEAVPLAPVARIRMYIYVDNYVALCLRYNGHLEAGLTIQQTFEQ